MPKMAQAADNGETGCAMAQMRIKDIAAEAGVSPATVSRYLNNRPGQMTEETRARIAAVIERTGYRPRAAARNLRSSRTNLIGVILADIANPFSSAMLEGLSASAAARGCSLMTAISGNDPAKEAESLTRLIDAGVDGLVVNTCGGNDKAIAAAAGRLPVVLLDRDVADGGVDLVTSNNRELVAGLVDALTAAGSERLCLLTEASDDSPVRRGLYRRAVATRPCRRGCHLGRWRCHGRWSLGRDHPRLCRQKARPHCRQRPSFPASDRGAGAAWSLAAGGAQDRDV